MSKKKLCQYNVSVNPLSKQKSEKPAYKNYLADCHLKSSSNIVVKLHMYIQDNFNLVQA